MNEDMKLIATRICELREIFGLTEQQMADDIGTTKEQYLEYESNGENIPISVLYHISQKFGVDMAEILTGNPARLNTYEICKRGQGQTTDRFTGYMYESLANKFAGKIMQPLLVTLSPTDQKAALVCHKGQEFNLVLEGTILLTYDNKEHTLNEGDAIYFDPTHPHGQQAIGETKARFLTVIAE